ncbi:ABC transporter ATP-binding protein [Streptomyces sp. NPDC047097]|uniref:ABC transporter ATP-binding protein n=1 Tax=Streptomyces sp. NPDC047097 TaxID=3155260 RepID=UPI00340CA708
MTEDTTRPAKILFEGVRKDFPVRDAALARRRGGRGLRRPLAGTGRPPVPRAHSAAGFTALDGVDLAIPAGEFTVVVGPSGCGKSTLLDLLAGLTRPTGGRILLDGRPVTGPGLDRGIVFQQYALLPWRTAQGNVEFGLEAIGVPRRERADRARAYLDLVGLTGFEDRHPHELSGGMRQRVAIARSLAYDPDVLLMDEPFAALDAQTRESLQDELLRIWRRTGKTILFITHGIEEAVYLGQRVAVMTSRPGRIKRVVPIGLGEQRATADDLRSSPEFARYRHEIWSLLHDEVSRAQQEEKEGVAV